MSVLVFTLLNVLLILADRALCGLTPLVGGEASHYPERDGHNDVRPEQVLPDLNGEGVHEGKQRGRLALGFLEEKQTCGFKKYFKYIFHSLYFEVE